jgi:hypothetical protein
MGAVRRLWLVMIFHVANTDLAAIDACVAHFLNIFSNATVINIAAAKILP